MSTASHPISRPRLEGSALTIVRSLWLLTAGTVLVLLVPEAQATFDKIHDLCPTDSCDTPRLPATAAHTLHTAGISLDLYAGYVIALAVIAVIVCYAVAGALMYRRSSDPMLILTAFLCVLLCTPNDLPLHQAGGVWTGPSQVVVILASVVTSAYLYLFPSGRFVPRWTILLAIGFIALQYLPSWFLPAIAWPLIFVGFLVSVVVLQVYRYRRVSTPIQQQQTKIVVFGIGVTCASIIVGVGLFEVDADITRQAVVGLLIPAMSAFAPLPFVIAIGVAVTRYRLWDVDVLINRTLVYLTLTASLAVVYLGSVILLQTLSRSVIGKQSDLAVAVSTLIIAALFNPLRRRVQAFIARAFYRHKYDAGKVLAAFGAQCRDETDLDALHARLLQVVDGAIQPAHITLWLPDAAGQHPAQS